MAQKFVAISKRATVQEMVDETLSNKFLQAPSMVDRLMLKCFIRMDMALSFSEKVEISDRRLPRFFQPLEKPWESDVV